MTAGRLFVFSLFAFTLFVPLIFFSFFSSLSINLLDGENFILFHQDLCLSILYLFVVREAAVSFKHFLNIFSFGCVMFKVPAYQYKHNNICCITASTALALWNDCSLRQPAQETFLAHTQPPTNTHTHTHTQRHKHTWFIALSVLMF